MAVVLSYSFARDFLNCPRKAQHRFVLKDIPKVQTPAMAEGIRVHTAFEHRLDKRTPLPDDLARYEGLCASLERSGATVYAEQKLGMTAGGRGAGFFGDGVWARGKADVTLLADNRAWIVDWKTGKPRDSDILELEVLAALMRANNSDIKSFVGSYVWLQAEKLGAIHKLDPDNGLNTLKDVDKQILMLQNADGPWPCNPNPLCGWCDVTKCEHYKPR